MHDDGYFGERVASRYDESAADMFDPAVVDPVVDFLATLAGNGRALELGIGTGRIALPLAARDVRVHGIEMSSAMIRRLRAKPGGDDIGVTMGDFATARADGSFSLAYLVFNAIMNLTTQEAQVSCFRHVAAHLQPGGCFVIEVAHPNIQAGTGRGLSPALQGDRHPLGVRRGRCRKPGPDISSLRSGRWATGAPVDPLSLRVALGARPDGSARWHAA